MSDMAVLDRKLKMMPQFNTQPLFDEWSRADEELAKLQLDRLAHEQVLSSAKMFVEDAMLAATADIEGKNETERKALRAAALKRDPTYLQAVMQEQKADMALSTCDASIDQIKRRIRRIEARIRVITEALHFLG